MAAIILDKVTKNFGALVASDRVSLDIGDGEFFTLLGPSGCGKTTTLRLVAGLEYPDSGNVLIGGNDVTRVQPAKRRIAMVFQNYALYPHMTIRQNISYPLRLRKVEKDEIERKVLDVSERLDIYRVLDRFPAEVSGGQQQRTAVARAMVQGPSAYLFDEPLSNLDARLRLESRRFLKQVLKETGGTAVYVTHDQTEAMALSDRVGVMRDGRLVQVAPPDELYARPADTFVAGFVGNLPMNLVKGKLTAGGQKFVAGDLKIGLDRTLPVKDGDDITLGVRPEDIAVIKEGTVNGSVVDVEHLGAERIVTFDCDGVDFFVRVVGDKRAGTGDKAKLLFPSDKMHFFDDSGDRIEAGQSLK